MKKLFILLSVVTFITSCGKPEHSNEAAVEIKKSALVAETTKLWNNGSTLHVVFLDGSTELQQKVAKYANEWTKYANLDFKFYSSSKALPKGSKANITITFKAKGNNSSVGTDSAHKFWGHSMSLSNLSPHNYVNRYYIIHEFGHAIGLHHEHQNIDRNFQLDEKNALKYCSKVLSMGEKDCRMHIFEIKSGKGIYSSKYDPKSIMHYSLHKDMLKNNVEALSYFNLSLLDKLEIAKLYPGKMDADTIIAEHKENEAIASSTSVYKNCKISDSVVERIRMNSNATPEKVKVTYYNFESIATSEFQNEALFEDKEVAIREMLENTYCNYGEAELKDFRASIYANRSKENAYGNCEILLNENGKSNSKLCTGDATFAITKKGKQELAIQACYYTFENARDAFKTTPYCNLTKEQISEIESAEAAKLKADMQYGKCVVVNVNDLDKSKKECPHDIPWFVTNESKRKILGSCTNRLESVIEAMKKAKICQP